MLATAHRLPIPPPPPPVTIPTAVPDRSLSPTLHLVPPAARDDQSFIPVGSPPPAPISVERATRRVPAAKRHAQAAALSTAAALAGGSVDSDAQVDRKLLSEALTIKQKQQNSLLGVERTNPGLWTRDFAGASALPGLEVFFSPRNENSTGGDSDLPKKAVVNPLTASAVSAAVKAAADLDAKTALSTSEKLAILSPFNTSKSRRSGAEIGSVRSVSPPTSARPMHTHRKASSGATSNTSPPHATGNASDAISWQARNRIQRNTPLGVAKLAVDPAAAAAADAGLGPTSQKHREHQQSVKRAVNQFLTRAGETKALVSLAHQIERVNSTL